MTDQPTGPLTDIELTMAALSFPAEFTASRLAREVVKWRAFFASLQTAVDGAGTIEEKLKAVTDVLEQFAKENP